MLSLLLSVLGGFAAWSALHFGVSSEHYFWNAMAGVAAFLLVMFIINLLLKKKLEQAFAQVQNHILEAQERISRKIRSIGMRATPKFQEEMEREQAKSIREAIDMMVILKPYEKWNLMIGRQVNTLKGQFHYQLKEYDKAYEYFQKSLLLDPMLVAMQMALYYRRGEDEKVRKCFYKGTGRFKDNKAVILYALYSWILVQQNKIDEAVKLLAEAKTRAENDVLKQNWDYLVNGHVRRFSNSLLGDQWYALMLETPKITRIQQQAGGGFGGGRRWR